ncbi:hypothetical protein GCM10025868_41810 [Angustibacter aerolatus]|uniref:Flagellar biosynthetic protein FliP n=1 Tax=Angustibacter aerolatus TaxID=1162965 RepID=A0ABQ6JL05_9ACTN|nr:hypothetical protein GCM10025868_41810 [Angustibacter aerolatus]
MLAGLALFLTMFVMAPTLTKMNHDGVQPYLKGDLSQSQAFEAGVKPLKDFMVKQTRPEEPTIITKAANMPRPKDAAHVPLTTLVPAFVLSEPAVGVRDRVPDLHPVPGDRPRRLGGPDVARHDDAAAGHRVAAVQACCSSSSSTAGASSSSRSSPPTSTETGGSRVMKDQTVIEPRPAGDPAVGQGSARRCCSPRWPSASASRCSSR